MIGLKMVGRMSLIIYFIVSACCLVPEASFQLDHLKLNAFKASRQFIPCTFGSHHDRVKNGRPDESYHQFIVSACCLGAWLVFCLWFSDFWQLFENLSKCRRLFCCCNYTLFFRCVSISRPGLVTHSLTLSVCPEICKTFRTYHMGNIGILNLWYIYDKSQANLRKISCKSQANLGQISGKSQAHLRQIKCKSRTNNGKILSRSWANLGQILCKSWAKLEQISGKSQANLRQILGKSWANLG